MAVGKFEEEVGPYGTLCGNDINYVICDLVVVSIASEEKHLSQYVFLIYLCCDRINLSVYFCANHGFRLCAKSTV